MTLEPSPDAVENVARLLADQVAHFLAWPCVWNKTEEIVRDDWRGLARMILQLRPSPSTGGASSLRAQIEALPRLSPAADFGDGGACVLGVEHSADGRYLERDAVLALCGDAHEGGTEEIECEECGGRGYHVGPICCGNLTKGGECRVECAVPEQTQCDVCEGSGRVEISESEGSRGAPSDAK